METEEAMICTGFVAQVSRSLVEEYRTKEVNRSLPIDDLECNMELPMAIKMRRRTIHIDCPQ